MNKNSTTSIVKIIKQVFDSSCRYFTVITVSLYVVGLFMAETEMVPTAGLILMVFGFSIIVSALNLIYTMKKLSYPQKVCFHFIGTFAGFYAIFIASGAFDKATIMMAVVIFIVAYFVIILATHGTKAIISSKSQQQRESDYTSQFDKMKK